MLDYCMHCTEYADLFCMFVVHMISVEQWRVAIGCFHAKSVYKPIATGE